MKHPGLEKARKRLKDAFRSLEDVDRATNLDDFESAWSRFLTAISATYNILGASCRGYPKSVGWFSRVQGQRKKDDLLSYLMHARNSNDHGIDGVVKLRRGGVGIGVGAREVYIERLETDEHGQTSVLRGSQDGGPLKVAVIPDRIELTPVVDTGVTYEPPKSFLGKPIPDPSPQAVGKVVLEFMTRLFGEAEKLVVEARG